MNIDNLKHQLKIRREKLAKLCDYPVILGAGSPISRNFAANHYYFRASSHFIYFTGISLPNAAIHLHQGQF
jgi:hypothetical protein